MNGLESVDDYNVRKRLDRIERERKERLTGVACPKCGGELEWKRDHKMPLSVMVISHTLPAECKKCSLSVELER